MVLARCGADQRKSDVNWIYGGSGTETRLAKGEIGQGRPYLRRLAQFENVTRELL